MERSDGYMNGGFGAFTFEDPLSEDENQDIHHAVEYSILQLNSAESNYVDRELRAYILDRESGQYNSQLETGGKRKPLPWRDKTEVSNPDSVSPYMVCPESDFRDSIAAEFNTNCNKDLGEMNEIFVSVNLSSVVDNGSRSYQCYQVPKLSVLNGNYVIVACSTVVSGLAASGNDYSWKVKPIPWRDKNAVVGGPKGKQLAATARNATLVPTEVMIEVLETVEDMLDVRVYGPSRDSLEIIAKEVQLDPIPWIDKNNRYVTYEVVPIDPIVIVSIKHGASAVIDNADRLCKFYKVHQLSVLNGYDKYGSVDDASEKGGRVRPLPWRDKDEAVFFITQFELAFLICKPLKMSVGFSELGELGHVAVKLGKLFGLKDWINVKIQQCPDCQSYVADKIQGGSIMLFKFSTCCIDPVDISLLNINLRASLFEEGRYVIGGVLDILKWRVLDMLRWRVLDIGDWRVLDMNDTESRVFDILDGVLDILDGVLDVHC